MKTELKTDYYFHKFRALSKQIQQISFTLGKTESKHPYHALDEESKNFLLSVYRSIRHDLQDLLEQFEMIEGKIKETERNNES